MTVFSLSSKYTAAAAAALALLSCTSAYDPTTCSADTIAFTTTDALGPFFVENSPQNTILAPRNLLIDPSNVFSVNGKVVGNNCRPLSNAKVEAWYAGEGGDYSDDEFRGQTTTNSCGDFYFTQTFPALYPQRPIPHIHYRVSTTEGVLLLTTQLYFEGAITEGFNPDATKIAQIVNQPDGSTSADFTIYVNAPGNVEDAVCSSGSVVVLVQEEDEEEAVTTTTNSTTNATMVEDMASSGSDGEGLIDVDAGEEVPVVCGDVVCEPGLTCCNPSCGTCVTPGSACKMVACVGGRPTPATPQQDETEEGTTTTTEVETSISKTNPDLFD